MLSGECGVKGMHGYCWMRGEFRGIHTILSKSGKLAAQLVLRVGCVDPTVWVALSGEQTQLVVSVGTSID
jgi:hypothetical protein